MIDSDYGKEIISTNNKAYNIKYFDANKLRILFDNLNLKYKMNGIENTMFNIFTYYTDRKEKWDKMLLKRNKISANYFLSVFITMGLIVV